MTQTLTLHPFFWPARDPCEDDYPDAAIAIPVRSFPRLPDRHGHLRSTEAADRALVAALAALLVKDLRGAL